MGLLSRRIEVIKWRDFVHMEQYELNFPDLTHPLDYIKMKWEEGEWNMYERDPDYIVGTDYVKSICKLEESSTQEMLCHIDSANWTLMKENGITKELYELMMYTGSTIRNGFDKEVERFEINWDAVENILSVIGGF